MLIELLGGYQDNKFRLKFYLSSLFLKNYFLLPVVNWLQLMSVHLGSILCSLLFIIKISLEASNLSH